MNNNIHELETHRLDIIDCINKGYGVSKIAKRLEVPRWTIIRDIKRMRRNRDSKLKDAYRNAKAQAQVNKQLTANLPNEKFLSMTGMTFKEKSFRNMIEFYKPELRKILKSEKQHTAINKLPKSIRRILKNNGIIAYGRKNLRITSDAREYLPKYEK